MQGQEVHEVRAGMGGTTDPGRAAATGGRGDWPRALRPCSTCGRPATADVVFEVDGLEREVRLCDEHLLELLSGARRIRRRG